MNVRCESQSEVHLNDYQLVLLYNTSFFAPAVAHPRTFEKTLNLQEGYTWDEQTLRELVLELLGLFRLVLGVPVESLSAAESARPEPRGIPRPRLPKRRR